MLPRVADLLRQPQAVELRGSDENPILAWPLTPLAESLRQPDHCRLIRG